MISLGGLAHKFAFTSPIFKPLLLEERERKKRVSVVLALADYQINLCVKRPKTDFCLRESVPEILCGLGWNNNSSREAYCVSVYEKFFGRLDELTHEDSNLCVFRGIAKDGWTGNIFLIVLLLCCCYVFASSFAWFLIFSFSASSHFRYEHFFHPSIHIRFEKFM